jgi:hypothetical protein
MASECTICIEKFNKSTRAPVTCAECDTTCCRTCLQRYLLESTEPEPHCPNCRRSWNREFIMANFTTKFLHKDLRVRREQILWDRESTLLPATQEDAARFLAAPEQRRTVEARITELLKLARVLPEVLAHTRYLLSVRLENKRPTAEQTAKHDALQKASRAAQEPLMAERATLEAERNRLDTVIRFYGRIGPAVTTTHVKKYNYVKVCGFNGCGGYISMDTWKCGLCATQVCKECHEQEKEGHRCDPAAKASVREIAKSSRPCPKCSIAISKIEGCDHMFCTACNTSFYWSSGEIMKTRNTNPHYHAWARANPEAAAGAGTDAGTALAAVDGPVCVDALEFRIRNLWRSYRDAKNTIYVEALDTILKHMQTLHHHQAISLNYVRHDLRQVSGPIHEENVRILRVLYLTKKKTKEEIMTALYLSERAALKYNAWIDFFTMFYATALDIFNSITATANPVLVLKQFQSFAALMEKEEKAIEKTYVCTSPFDRYIHIAGRQT